MRDHRKFDAFQIADKLVVLVYEVTRAWPREEVFGLTSQVRRGAVSVVSNIVEGCGRETDLDFRHFLVMAHAACRELEYQISLAARLKYPTRIVVLEGNFSEPRECGESVAELSDRTSRVLAGLVKSIPPKAHFPKAAS